MRRLRLSLLALLVLVVTVPAVAVAGEVALINEVRADQDGADVEEYVEIYTTRANLDGYTLVIIGDSPAGGSGVVEVVVDLGDVTWDGDFVLVGRSVMTLAVPDATFGGIENEDNVTLLLVTGWTGSNGADLDTNDDGTLDATPWTGVASTVALIRQENPPSSTEYHYGDHADCGGPASCATVGPDGTLPPFHAYRCPDGGLEWRIGARDVTVGNDTPGAANDCGGAGDPGADVGPDLDMGVDLDAGRDADAVGEDASADADALLGDADAVGDLASDAGAPDGSDAGGGDGGADDADAARTDLADLGASALSGRVWMNELRRQESGDDTHEFIELFGEAGLALDGLSLVVLGDGAGGDGHVEVVIPFDGETLSAGGLLTAARRGDSEVEADLRFETTFENDDNATYLLVSGFRGGVGDDLDEDDDGALDRRPWRELVDVLALAIEENPPVSTEFHYGPPGLCAEGTLCSVVSSDGAPLAHVYRCPDLRGPWILGGAEPEEGLDTPGARNACGDEPGDPAPDMGVDASDAGGADDADATLDVTEDLAAPDVQSDRGEDAPDSDDAAIDVEDGGLVDLVDLGGDGGGGDEGGAEVGGGGAGEEGGCSCALAARRPAAGHPLAWALGAIALVALRRRARRSRAA